MAAPSNDNWANATEIVLVNGQYVSQPVHNAEATAEPTDGDYGAYGGHSLWWKYTPPTNTRFTVDADLTTNPDGHPVNYTIGFNSDNGAGGLAGITFIDGTWLNWGLVGGTTYYFVIDAYGDGSDDLYVTLRAAVGDSKGTGTTPTNGGGGGTPVAPNPDPLTGTEGAFTLAEFSTANDVLKHYTPDIDGSMFIQVVSPEGYSPTYTVTDSDGDEIQDDEGSLSLVWVADEQMTIAITAADASPTTVEFSWTYAPRASPVLYVALETEELSETPAGLEISIFNGQAGDTVTLSLIGPTTVADFQTAVLDDTGIYDSLIVRVPALEAGDYLLRVEGTSSGSQDTALTVTGDALQHGDGPKPAPMKPTYDPAQHWRFIDMRDHADVYTFPHNPASWTNIFPPNDFTHDNTTAVDGQMLTWQAAARPWRVEFTGQLDTQEHYEALQFWSAQRRRFWLIDHRNRAWLITIEQFDAQAQVKPNKPWAHQYTVKTLVFMQG